MLHVRIYIKYMIGVGEQVRETLTIGSAAVAFQHFVTVKRAELTLFLSRV